VEEQVEVAPRSGKNTPATPFSIRTADAGGHESIMPGAKHCLWQKLIPFLATHV